MSGSWTLDKAIAQRWQDRNMDAKFRAFWTDPADVTYETLYESQAPANSPKPYCIFERATPVLLHRSTGKRADNTVEIETWQVPVQFRVYGSENQSLSAKEFTHRRAKEVLESFEPKAGYLAMEDDDCHVQTLVGADMPIREDDDVYQWVLMFDIQIERTRGIVGLAEAVTP